MRGASALQAILDERRGDDIVGLVVWEPVILTDLGPPSPRTRARIPDPRVMQFWDRKLVLSGEILRALSANPQAFGMDAAPDERVAWDCVALYPPGVRWVDAFPAPEFWGAPVVDVTDELIRRLAVATSN